SRHIDLNIGRDPIPMIRKPLDQARIFQRRNSYRAVLIIDLGIQLIHFKLGHHIHHASHLSVSEERSRISVKKKDLIKRELLNILGELTCLNCHELLVFLCVNDRRRQQGSRKIYDNDRGKEAQDHLQSFGILDLIPVQILFLYEKCRRQNDQDSKKDPEFCRMDIDGRQRRVIVDPQQEYKDNSKDHFCFQLFHSLFLSKKAPQSPARYH